jgi:hypothetical protein
LTLFSISQSCQPVTDHTRNGRKPIMLSPTLFGIIRHGGGIIALSLLAWLGLSLIGARADGRSAESLQYLGEMPEHDLFHRVRGHKPSLIRKRRGGCDRHSPNSL